MALRITLKPGECLIINGAVIRNGNRNTSLLMESQCRFLRESEIVRENEADTACKNLCVTLQVIHLSDNPVSVIFLLIEQALQILRAIPSTAPYLLAIQVAVDEGQTHKAIKLGKELVDYEKTLIDCLCIDAQVAF